MTTPNETPTPFTDDLEDAYNRRACGTAVVFSRMREKERELAEAKEKLEFLKTKGLTVGLMKTSDKPEPYLVYVIESGSELCNLATVNKLIDTEIERDELCAKLQAAEAACAEMRELLDRADFVFPKTARKARELLEKSTLGQGWHSPEESAAKDARIAGLEQQLTSLRKLFPEILSALGSGGCTEDASLEFLQHIPNEVRLVVLRFKQQLAEARKDSERLKESIEEGKRNYGYSVKLWRECAKALATAIDDERKSDGSRGIYCAMTLSYAQEAGNIALKKFHELESGTPDLDNAKGDK